MILEDKMYGTFHVREDIINDILRSSCLQRLKGITQNGMPESYCTHESYSRYKHSPGVFLLLRKFDASLEDQVAGLVHDISHMAFSHVAEWVFDKGSDGVENYHDRIYGQYLRGTDLYHILKKGGYTRLIRDATEGRPLLKNSIPNICADRLDYSLREMKIALGTEKKVIDQVLKDLIVYKGEFIFTEVGSASIFGENFLKLQSSYWGSYLSIAKYFYFSNTLKTAIERSCISKKDFFESEMVILEKLLTSNDKEILKELRRLEKNNVKDFKKLGVTIKKKSGM